MSTYVIKYGGHAMAERELAATFALDIAWLRERGDRVVVVHGGGPHINAMLSALQVPTEFRGGYRVTDAAVMRVVRMVLAGDVQRDIVGLLTSQGLSAVGLSGDDANVMRAQRRTVVIDGVATDIGFVGDVESVNADFLNDLISDGHVPVISPVANDASGQPHNINADTAAAAVAQALEADRLLVLTDVAGLYRSWPDESSLVNAISLHEIEQLLPSLSEGMVPKIEGCVGAVRAGVRAAQIVDGRTAHAVHSALTIDRTGTVITR